LADDRINHVFQIRKKLIILFIVAILFVIGTIHAIYCHYHPYVRVIHKLYRYQSR
jgi:hypothetical protein